MGRPTFSYIMPLRKGAPVARCQLRSDHSTHQRAPMGMYTELSGRRVCCPPQAAGPGSCSAVLHGAAKTPCPLWHTDGLAHQPTHPIRATAAKTGTGHRQLPMTPGSTVCPHSGHTSAKPRLLACRAGHPAGQGQAHCRRGKRPSGSAAAQLLLGLPSFLDRLPHSSITPSAGAASPPGVHGAVYARHGILTSYVRLITWQP
jgi:hypothetical protein